MSSWDDDDWTGTPPEGRHTREQSNPGFWGQRRLIVSLVWAGLFVLALVVVALVVL